MLFIVTDSAAVFVVLCICEDILACVDVNFLEIGSILQLLISVKNNPQQFFISVRLLRFLHL